MEMHKKHAWEKIYTNQIKTKLMKLDRRTDMRKIPDVPGSQELYGWNSGYL